MKPQNGGELFTQFIFVVMHSLLQLKFVAGLTDTTDIALRKS
jgi:hypothetical protein